MAPEAGSAFRIADRHDDLLNQRKPHPAERAGSTHVRAPPLMSVMLAVRDSGIGASGMAFGRFALRLGSISSSRSAASGSGVRQRTCDLSAPSQKTVDR
jgi:hypothetical protein